MPSVFDIIAEPNRRAILGLLISSEQSVGEIERHLGMPQPAVSKHLRVLHKAGLVTRTRDAQWRPVKLAPAPLKGVAEWVDRYREMWEERFDRLDQYLRELQASEKKPKAPKRKRRNV